VPFQVTNPIPSPLLGTRRYNFIKPVHRS